MTTTSEARKNIKYLSSVLRGLVALDDELEEVGSIEKLAIQKQAVVDGLDRQEVAARQRLNELAKEYDARRRSAEAEVQTMTANAAAVLADAQAQRQEAATALDRVREDIVAKMQTAATDADAVLAEARTKAAAIAADTEAHLRANHAQVSKELEAVRDEVKAAQAMLATVKADIEKATQDKTDLDALIEMGRKRFAV